MKKNLLKITFASLLALTLGACSCSGNNGGNSGSSTSSNTSTPVHEHTPDEHGVCTVCGAYRGDTKTATKEDPYVLENIVAGREYYFRLLATKNVQTILRSDINPKADMTKTKLWETDGSVWNEIPTNAKTHVISNISDGFYYVRYVSLENIAKVNWWVENHVHDVDAQGFCKVCDEFTGRDFDATTENQLVTVNFTAVTGNADYVRIKVKAGRTYEFDYTDSAFDYFDDGSGCWYRDSTTKQFEELYPGANIDIPSASDGYVYFTAVYAKSGSFSLYFKLKVVCDHSLGTDSWGFCLNEECKTYLGHEHNYENNQTNISALADGEKDYYAIDLYSTNNHVFMIDATAGGLVSLGYMNSNKAMVSLQDGIDTDGGVYYLPENILTIAKYQRLYVAIDNQSGGELTGKMAVGSIGPDGFDFVPGFKWFHGPEIASFGTTYDIDPFFVYQYHFDDPTPGDYYYYGFTFEATVGLCYKLECDGFDPLSVMMYKMNGGNKVYANPVEGGFEANGTRMYGLIVTDISIDNNNSICLFDGHFPDDSDVYKGFYCKHHDEPVWMGEPNLVVDGSPINILLGAGEKKYYRFDVSNITHHYALNPSNGASLNFSLYYWDGSKMVEIDAIGQWTYELPQTSPVEGETEGYYFLTIENALADLSKDFTFFVSEEHNYNEFGICWYDGSFRPNKSYVVSEEEVTNHTPLNFNLAVGDQKFFKVPMSSGHSFKLEFNDVNNPTLAENNQIKFAAVMTDDYEPIEITYDEVGTGYIKATMPTGISDYLYVLVTPTTNINSAGFKFYDNGHYYNYFGRCDCYDYNGVTLAFDMPLTGQPDLAPGEVLKFRFEADEAYTRYFIKFEDQIEKDDLRVVYYTGAGGSVELTNDIEQSDTTFIIHFNNYDDCDDGYVYIRLQNSTLSSYVINGLVFDNQLE